MDNMQGTMGFLSNRAVRVYRLYGWGVGETIKRKGGVSQACLANPHLVYWTFTIWSIDSSQNRIATDQYHMTISRAHVSTHRGDVIYLEAVRWPENCLKYMLDRNQCSISYFLASLGEHGKLQPRPKAGVLSWSVIRAKSGRELARERLANIGKIPVILAQVYPWSQFSSINVCVLLQLVPDGMEISRNAGKS